MGVLMVDSRWKSQKERLMAETPYCYSCGVDHGIGASFLEFHHITPRHKNLDEHEGVLLCRRCHNDVHIQERNAHKVADDRGYSPVTPNVYRGNKNQKKLKREQHQELIDQWTK